MFSSFLHNGAVSLVAVVISFHCDKVVGSDFTHFAQWLHVECLLFVASIKGSKLVFIICLLSSASERASGSAPHVFFARECSKAASWLCKIRAVSFLLRKWPFCDVA